MQARKAIFRRLPWRDEITSALNCIDINFPNYWIDCMETRLMLCWPVQCVSMEQHLVLYNIDIYIRRI